MLRLALNATALIHQAGGIARYCRALAAALEARDDVEPHYFYGSHWSSAAVPVPPRGVGTAKRLIRRLVPRSQRVIRSMMQQRFTDGVRRLAADVYHDPSFLAFDFAGPTVTTIHDLSYVKHPNLHPAARVELMCRVMPGVIDRSTFLITPSRFVRDEVMDFYAVRPERVRAIAEGVDACFHPRSAEETAHVLRPLGLDHGRYILSLGTIEPRKNLAAVLDAYALLPRRCTDEFVLVIAGMKGWHNRAVETELERLVAHGRVKYLGFVPDDDLFSLLAGAALFLFPSLYEGFGLPPLEAMASGVPVIASNRASLPEVIGDAGVAVDAEDVEELAAAIESLLDDPVERARRSQLGVARAQDFTWGRCAEATVSTYRDAVGG